MADVRCADIEKTCVADLRFLPCLDAAKKIGVMRTSWLDLKFELFGRLTTPGMASSFTGISLP
jgi:hypothetical protein